ncbi:MAG: response regulator [Sulfuritalea sp.]|nr:response regulator [Sulfuritalea sp.]
MEELLDAIPVATAAILGSILIVDDDPAVAGMLGVALAAAGHQITEANSGEEALAYLTKCADSTQGPLPEVVFLDIEMGMGIDGHETCRRLCAADATRDLPVIFLSGHDALDDRLRAYDAGGSDFMPKPFVTNEVLRKAALAIRHRRWQLAAADSRTSFDAALTALTSLNESGVTFKYSRGALGCRTLHTLAKLTVESMAYFGIDCHVQLRAPTQTLTQTPRGPASPLEESVIEKMRPMDRIFSFKNRLIVNYDKISLLVTNMPVADEELCGRIRDHAATIAEAAELAVENVSLHTEAIRIAEELRQLAKASRVAVEQLRGNYRELQLATRVELDTLAHTIEGMYVHLGLTNKQEFTISDTVRGAVDRVLTLFEHSSELDRNFAGIVTGLTKAGEYTVVQEDEAAPTVELW